MHNHRKPVPNRSYWLKASNYYVMALAIALAAFFLVLGLLRDENEESLVPAGIVASFLLVFAVVIRQAIVTKRHIRLSEVRQLENNLLALRAASQTNENKLTIEKNAAILHELKKKSEAATVLGKYADGHREVFQLCGQYLEINEKELRTVNPGSPRIGALRRGREVAEGYHRRHMLKWAEIETTSFLDNAQAAAKAGEKIDLARKALAIIASAEAKYPAERKLKESAAAISEFIITIKAKDLVERAGKAESRGNTKLAVKHFENALCELDKSAEGDGQRDAAKENIRVQLERLANSATG